ncbi:hypothetical protein CCH79_00019903 [Gambusia affinis]|uniref:Uncharacterized protein n=1 Tax=Gambusia affinis TaxID=33528 RepID=A0A315V857_GAMAF|nr:hypothetical protein CCH79_00019903 [Gambusia affinis]
MADTQVDSGSDISAKLYASPSRNLHFHQTFLALIRAQRTIGTIDPVTGPNQPVVPVLMGRETGASKWTPRIKLGVGAPHHGDLRLQRRVSLSGEEESARGSLFIQAARLVLPSSPNRCVTHGALSDTHLSRFSATLIAV